MFACISPWNFPLAIFTGQVAAALAAGNCVVAKPAEQTPITAMLAVRLLHEAGVPTIVLHLLPGDGAVGAALVKDPRINGVVFTGSNETAWRIQRALADRRGAIVPFIAETGGINAMIADSQRAARAGGPRCRALGLRQRRASAARPRACCSCRTTSPTAMIDMLAGAIEALDIGDPFDFATDIGPSSTRTAQDALEAHKLSACKPPDSELIDKRAARRMPRRHLRDAGRVRDRQAWTCSITRCSGRSCTSSDMIKGTLPT